MATALAISDILKVSAIWVCGGQEAVNTFHYLVTAAGGTPATDLDVLTTMDTAAASLAKAIIPSNARFDGWLGAIISRDPPPVTVQSTAGAGAGASGIIPFPKQATGITSWYTANAGRAFRGRTYWPFLSSNYADTNGEINTGGVTAMDALAAAIQAISAINVTGRTATIQFGIYHRKTKSMSPIVVRTTRRTVATQKRRGDFGRPNTAPI